MRAGDFFLPDPVLKHTHDDYAAECFRITTVQL